MKEGGRGAFSKATDVGKVCVNAAGGGGGRGRGGKVSRAEMKTHGEEVEAMCAEASAGEFPTFLRCSSDDQPALFSPPRVNTRGFGAIGSGIEAERFLPLTLAAGVCRKVRSKRGNVGSRGHKSTLG